MQEIENNGSGDGSAIATLAGLLNDAGTGADYAWVDPTGTGGYVGTDAITAGIIYDQNAVTLLYSEYHVYDEASAEQTYAVASVLADALGIEFGDYQRNRPSVAATFQDNATGETFTVVSSHFKSKGDSGLQDIADAAEASIANGEGKVTQAELDALLNDPNFDQGNGQGFWNAARADAAGELSVWISSEYDGSGTDTYLLLGDMNSYAQEDPVQTLREDAGLTDLIEAWIGQDEAYSYVYDGQEGTLDQGFADNTLASLVTGVTEWHINADEPSLINYDETYENPSYYNDGVFSSSDHDPLIVGLDLTPDLLVA